MHYSVTGIHILLGIMKAVLFVGKALYSKVCVHEHGEKTQAQESCKVQPAALCCVS